MSFQAYIDNIKTKTGKSPADFKKLADKKGILKEGAKAGDFVKWAKQEFDLGHGHSMALWPVFKMNGWVDAKGNKQKAIGNKSNKAESNRQKAVGSKQKEVSNRQKAIGNKAESKSATVKRETTDSKTQAAEGKALVDKYIAGFPKATQVLLEKMRSTIKKAAPNAAETIGYGIPTFKLNGNLVHYAGYDQHIGFYPGAAGIASFQEEISKYKNAKGSVQFPIDKPLPLALVTTITKFRVLQNEAKTTKGK